jgi:hypothetical protein
VYRRVHRPDRARERNREGPRDCFPPRFGLMRSGPSSPFAATCVTRLTAARAYARVRQHCATSLTYIARPARKLIKPPARASRSVNSRGNLWLDNAGEYPVSRRLIPQAAPQLKGLPCAREIIKYACIYIYIYISLDYREGRLDWRERGVAPPSSPRSEAPRESINS